MIGIVGLGRWGRHHASFLEPLVGRDAIVGVDPDAGRRAALEAEGIRTVAHVDALPPGVDGVVLATPAGTHAEIGTALLARGVPLLVEGPLAGTVADARKLVEAAAAQEVPLMVGHIYLFQRAHERLREAAAGLGAIRFASFERRIPGPVRPHGGAWDELAPHELAAACDLMELDGDVRHTAFLPWSAGQSEQDGALARLEVGGVVVEVRCSWVSAIRSRRVWLVGDRGQAYLSDEGGTRRVASWHGSHDWTRVRPDEPSWEVVDGPPPLELELRAFLAGLDGGGGPRADGSLGLRVVELATQAVR